MCGAQGRRLLFICLRYGTGHFQGFTRKYMVNFQNPLLGLVFFLLTACQRWERRVGWKQTILNASLVPPTPTPQPHPPHKFVKQADLPKVALQVKLMIGVIATSYPRRKNCKCTKEIELLTCVWVTSSLATLIVLIPFKKC